MVLTKHGAVMKTLIEEVLRRHGQRGAVGREPGDVKMAIDLMAVMMRGQPVYAVADAGRFVQDFREVTSISARHLYHPDMCHGIGDCHIVVFHTGSRNQRQQDVRDSIMGELRTRRGIQYWHVGEWRE